MQQPRARRARLLCWISAIASTMTLALAPAWAETITASVGMQFGPEVRSVGIATGNQRAWVNALDEGTKEFCEIEEAEGGFRCHANLRGSLTPGYGANELDLGEPASRTFVDITGSGIAAFCRLVRGPKVRCDAFAPNAQGAIVFWKAFELGGQDFDPGWSDSRWWVDVDGNGTADYCRLVGRVRIACTLTGSQGFGETVYSDWLSDAGWVDSRAWADVNGDGKADFCRLVGNWTRIRCTLSTAGATGKGAFAEKEWDSVYVDGGARSSGRWWVDVNGDGKADFCRIIEGTTLACTLSNGTTGFSSTSYTASIDPGVPDSRGWVDLNGDGKMDFCRWVTGPARIRCTLAGEQGWGVSWESPALEPGWPSVANGYQAWLSPSKAHGYPMFCRALALEEIGCLVMPYRWEDEAIELDTRPTLTLANVTVGVADTGVRFLGQLAGEEAFSASYPSEASVEPGSDEQGNADAHGTQIASVVAGRDIGISPGVKIANLRMTDDEPVDLWDEACLFWDTTASAHQLRVLNVSLGFSNTTRYCLDWDDTIHKIGVGEQTLIVAAVGNDGAALEQLGTEENSLSPAIYHPLNDKDKAVDPVIRVASLDHYSHGETPKLAAHSNYGADWVDIAAPGVDIPVMTLTGASPGVDGGLEPASGTSVATAVVSGVLARMVACAPKLTAQQLKRALLDNADTFESLAAQVKSGRVLNAKRALAAACPEHR